jgi:23S rRNA pseudouridine2604 synthase
MDSAPLTRINKYLAEKKYCTRKEADELVKKGRVLINGRLAVLGDKVSTIDKVEVRFRPKKFRYFAYNKPRGVITHSPQQGETEIIDAIDLQGVFPVGRLDKDSSGLIILTDDGRLTDALLNPEHEHEKEYEVLVSHSLANNFQRRMEKGVFIGDYTTKPCKVDVRGETKFVITLTEGKKHQIRRMCDAVGQTVDELKRTRIMNVKLGSLAQGAYRKLQGAELEKLLKAVGIPR